MSSHSARPIPLPLALLPFAVTITGLLAAIFWIDAPLYLGLLCGWLTASVIALRCGKGWRSVGTGTYAGMKSTFMVISILLMIAGVIASWLVSGTVPGLILYGSKLISPDYLVVTAFLLAAATSMALGSSVGTLSTLGAAIAGMAAVFGIPPALIGGALISGAMVGDRTSPVSGSFHLVAGMTGTKAEDNYRPMWSTGIPMILICTLAYFWLGLGKATGQADPLDSPLLHQLRAHFDLPWAVLLPPVLVLALAALRVKITYNLGIGMLFGGVLAVWVQGTDPLLVLQAVWSGYELTESAQQVLHGGGVWPMFNQILLILTAGALNGTMEQTGMLQTILQVLLDRIRTATGLIASTVFLSIAMALLACNQSIAIIVPGRTMRTTYDRMGVPPAYLVRSLADSGVVVSALTPWNLHGILCSTAIGIGTSVYSPYAFFLWGLPILTILLAFRLKNKQNSDCGEKLLQF